MPVLDVTIPVYNEERDLEECLRRLHAYLRGTFPHSFRITVADNASTDGTLKAAERRTTWWPWHRESRASRVWAARCSGSGVPCRPRRCRSPQRWQPPAPWPFNCWAARPPTSRGSGGRY
ncbi:glycosyltransferase [Arthrobacter sp. UC242_113]|uniref:glycosyltransferase n=1 Tax=Arthrobacter sp. UC242_113 TaxID=3374550 RepID=UPI0037565637